MATRKPPLGVWLYGVRIGEVAPMGRGYDVSLRYSDEACDRWPGNIPLLSCSLPLGRSRLNATEYFRGLLPEGQHLQFLAAQAKVSTSDLYSLLARYGRDVAGAVVVSAHDPLERVGDAVVYADESLADEVAGLTDRPLALYDDSELSIPGLQNKLLLIKTEAGWARPVGGRPSTHILKVEDARYPGLATMEHASMSIAKRLGLTTSETKVENFAGVHCLIISRFDRAVDEAGDLRRIHQEDACQALGIDPLANQGRGKYERYGGPSLVQIAQLLERHATSPERELARLVRAVTFTVLSGNGDAHGKNLSLLHPEPGVVELAPLYDVVPTALWSTLPDRAAMHVNGVSVLSRVGFTDVLAEAQSWSLPRTVVTEAIEEITGGIPDALEDVPDALANLILQRIQLFLGS